MRPRTRTQCQDGPPATDAHPPEGEAAGPAAPPEGSPPSAVGCPADAGQFDAASSVRDDDSVFAVPSLFSAAKRAPSSVGSSSASANVRQPILVELPAEVLVKILGYLPYSNVGALRLVSRRFNELCASVLNSTFLKLQGGMMKRLQSIKDRMPRRESARRNHPLARENDIVETVQMRLTLLQMTFGKHIDRKHVCFFAGEILDEVYNILRYMKNNPNMTKCLKVTDELCDLCTMAMEYFKDKIEPTLPEITFFGTDFLDFATPYTTPCKRRMQSGASAADSPCSSRASVAGSSCSEPWGGMMMGSQHDDDAGGSGGNGGVGVGGGGGGGGNVVMRKRLKKMGKDVKKVGDDLVEVRGELKTYKARLDTQSKQTTECSRKMEEYDKKFEENEKKVQSIVAELNKCRNELNYWRSKAVALASSSSASASGEAPLGEGPSSGPANGVASPLSPMVFPPITCSKCDAAIDLADGDVVDAAAAGGDDSDGEVVEPRVLRSGPPSPAAAAAATTPSRKRKAKEEDSNVTRKSLRGAGVKNRKKPKLAGN